MRVLLIEDELVYYKLISPELKKAGYDFDYGKVSLSSRQDLCQYQCSGALAAARVYKKAPFEIAEEVVSMIEGVFDLEVVKPGFININLKESLITDYLNQMMCDARLGYTLDVAPKIAVTRAAIASMSPCIATTT